MLKTIGRLLNLKMDRELYTLSWLAFAFLTFLLLSTLLKTDAFYHDSATYWYSNATFFKNGSFNFTNYDVSYRGYFFPLFLMPAHALSKILGGYDFLLYNLFAAVGHSFFIVVILPLLIKETFYKEIKLYMIIAFYAMIMFFYYGYIVFPLTDLWAIYFFCSAILIVKTQKFGLWGVAFAGVILGLTCNTRPIYLCLVPLFIIYTLLQNSSANRRVAVFLILIFGVYLAWLPQVIINKANYNTYSPLIQTHLTFGDGLYFTQLNLGFIVEKYESDVSKPPDQQAVYYYNRRALSIIEKEQLPPQKPFKDKSSIIELFAKYPVDFFRIYSSHIFNAMDIKYPECYTSDYYRSRLLFSLINYTVIFIGLVLLFVNYKTIFNAVFYDWKNILLLSMVLLPVILTTPTQLEVRFFLPIHLALYAACCFGAYPHRTFFKERSNYLSIILSYVIFVGFCFYISSQTVAANPVDQTSRLKT